jgi:hypothetical protein
MIIFMLLMLAFSALILMLLLIASGNLRRRKISALVAEAGYETAHDILFPGRSRRRKSRSGFGPGITV